MTASSNEPAVIILGGLNGLGLCRSLGAEGIKSYVVDTSRLAPAMLSRHAYPVVVHDTDTHCLIDSLLSLQRSLGFKPVLFNTDERAVYVLSEFRDALMAAFHFHLPAHQTLVALQDKARFNDVAAATGLPVPRGAVLRSSADLPALGSLCYPIVVKPSDKSVVHARRMQGITVFDRECHATSYCEQSLAKNGGSLIAQEWIVGASEQIYFCLFYADDNAENIVMFTGRKLASRYPDGTTAYCTAAPDVAEELEELTRSFIAEFHYSGMGGVEYKWDSRSQRFLIIEPTVGRSDMQAEIATLCGVNIPLTAYRYELGGKLQPSKPSRNDVVWRASLLDAFRSASVKLPPGVEVNDGFWRCNDPLPGIAKYGLGIVSTALRPGTLLNQSQKDNPYHRYAS